MFKILLPFAIIYLPEIISIKRSLIITTENGPVKGKLNNFNGIEFYSYQGIPYAENPTGVLRFKPPVPRKSWADVLDATQEGAICSQLSKFYIAETTSENCLNVNVYVPKLETDTLLPVMVFIHGGALQYLSGRIDISYGPQLLMGHEIIYVSINYRLGPFGFLSLDIEEASGNAGLKDVLLSLKWVKQNIKNFGGNPHKTTIAGHSSGSLIINFLMLTNQSYGLFNQAIQIGGTAFSPRSFAIHSKDISFTLAKELEIETKDVYKILENLQKIDAFKILRAYHNMEMAFDSPLRAYAPFVPSKEVESKHAFLVMDPMEALRNNNVMMHKVPILFGMTSQEAVNMIPHVLQKTEGVERIRKNPEHLIPSNIEYPLGSEKSKNLGKLISEMYFGEEMKNLTLTTFIEFMSDTQNVYGFYFWIEKCKKLFTGNPLYFYMFDFKGKLNRNQYYFNSSVSGFGHGDDIPYVFVANVTKTFYNSLDEKSGRMSHMMLDLVSNFLHFGNPTPEHVNNKFIWPDYSRQRKYLLLNENPVVQSFSSTPIYSRMQFWERVYNEYYEYLGNGGEIEKKIIP